MNVRVLGEIKMKKRDTAPRQIKYTTILSLKDY
jgi:hypothetical protein